MLEFFFDTTRAVVDLVLNGTVAQHPGIEFLIPHAGATLPMVADRVSVFSQLLGVDPSVDVLRDLGRLHFDLAGFPLPRQLDALLTLTTLEHLHYGSDYPFTPEFAAAMAGERLAEVGRSARDRSSSRAPGQHRTPLPRPPRRPSLTTGTPMNHQLELGYLVLEMPEPDSLDTGLRRRGRPRPRRADGIGRAHLAQ